MYQKNVHFVSNQKLLAQMYGGLNAPARVHYLPLAQHRIKPVRYTDSLHSLWILKYLLFYFINFIIAFKFKYIDIHIGK